MKSTKKSMLITTILMVVLLIVALSTATFAWYTAQSNATVTETTVTSATSSSASLVIDATAATSNTAKQSEVTITMNQAISPAMYNSASAPVVGTTTYTDFVGAFISYTIDNGGKYVDVPKTTTVATINQTVGTTTTTTGDFYVTNVGGVNSNITATVTINPNYYAVKTVATNADVSGLYTKNETTGAYDVAIGNAVDDTTYYELKANNFLRVAMFVDGKYAATWATSEQTDVKYAEIALTGDTAPKAGDTPASHSSYTATASGSSPVSAIASNIAPMGSIKVQLVAWFEGDSHTNAYAGTGALFTVVFNGESVVA